MNVVKILLILGLGYIAITQKVEKTRNMLLVVTGLLAFCMFSMEGFTDITFTGGAGKTASTAAARLAVGGNVTANGAVYTFPANFAAATGIPTWTCPTGKIPGTVNASARSSGNDPLTADNINNVFPCVTGGTCPSTAPTPDQCGPNAKFKATSGATYTGDVGGPDYVKNCCQVNSNQSCADGKTSLKKTCPDFYSDIDDANCSAKQCVDTDFSISGPCCEKSCSDDDCDDLTFMGVGAPKDGKICEKSFFGLLEYYCKK